MRLGVAALVLVLLGSVLTGVATASGAAANPLITLRALDREGTRVTATASLEPVTGGSAWLLTTAYPVRVPRGHYNLDSWVSEPGRGAVTFVDREVIVTGSGTVTLKTRTGRRVRFTVNDPTVAVDRLLVEAFPPGSSDIAFPEVSTEPTYVVPGKLPRGWGLYLLADLVRPHQRVSPVEYGLVRVFHGSIPASLTFASDKARLASDHVTVRQVNPLAPQSVWFYPMIDAPAFEDFPAGPFTVGQWATGPFSFDLYVTPGYAWLPCGTYGEGGCGFVPDAAPWGVRHYAQTFGSAVFGPAGQPARVRHSTLYAGLGFGLSVLDDPGYATPDSPGLAVRDPQVWIYQGGKLLGHSTTGTAHITGLTSATRWYRMRLAAKRGLGLDLFRSVTLTCTFPAHASGGSYRPGAIWPRIIPSGLSRRNAAARGTKTTVPIWFVNPDGSRIAARGVAVWSSVNGGKTWTALRVTHSRYRWTAVVANPGRAGYVSLRVRGADAAGRTSTVTITYAYRVS